ncbi:hypothetical protein BpHYR1_032791 [Brachionus plicatilis]|uniref:Uncharacterized protein n=1 Tax=Brachionus plicatilis TaxID=10195 RepID=A0A3M7SSX9_BRAPC|nr:hypothetical protein BpHYR1_032791 [Brachionus plicatilis]
MYGTDYQTNLLIRKETIINSYNLNSFSNFFEFDFKLILNIQNEFHSIIKQLLKKHKKKQEQEEEEKDNCNINYDLKMNLKIIFWMKLN